MKVKRQRDRESTLQETRLVTTSNCNLAQSFNHTKPPHPTPRQSPPPQIITHKTSDPLCHFSARYETGSSIGKEAGYDCFLGSSTGREPVCSASRVAGYRPDEPRMNATHDQGWLI
jgi:hypothetical protein